MSSVPKPSSPRTTKSIKITHLLKEDTVLVRSLHSDKNKLLEALVARLCEKNGLSEVSGIITKVQEREQGISTTLDTGLSLPHVRLDNLSSIVAALAVVASPIIDPKQPDLAIRVMFLFFSPNKPESFPLHLQLLRGVSSLFQPALIDQLVSAPSPGAVLELLRKAEA